MDAKEIIENAKRIKEVKLSGWGKLSEATEFLRVYAGENSSFYKQMKLINPRTTYTNMENLANQVLDGFIRYVENGLIDGISIERKAQIDVVSDILDQANKLLESKGSHPAGPAMIIGAVLEEFLRNWIEDQEISLDNKKQSIDVYTSLLKEKGFITKQDVKDIVSWAGLRNHAAHGEWDEVKDKKRISMMLEGVNLFMRKYGK